jgi:hypothetical protein
LCNRPAERKACRAQAAISRCRFRPAKELSDDINVHRAAAFSERQRCWMTSVAWSTAVGCIGPARFVRGAGVPPTCAAAAETSATTESIDSVAVLAVVALSLTTSHLGDVVAWSDNETTFETCSTTATAIRSGAMIGRKHHTSGVEEPAFNAEPDLRTQQNQRKC